MIILEYAKILNVECNDQGMILNYHKSFPVILFLIISTLIPVFSQSPDLSMYIQGKHGQDQTLINGIIYFDKFKKVKNHPFHGGEESLPGSIVLSGISYEDVQIHYDIYSQYLVLDNSGVSRSLYNIIINPEHVDAFHLDGEYFNKISLDEHGPLFYQVIRINNLICYIHYEKQMTPNSDDTYYTNYFTNTKQSYFLDVYGKISPFTNRRSFVTLISGVPKKEIKRYMRRNEIRFSDATSWQIENLLLYITSSVKSTTGN